MDLYLKQCLFFLSKIYDYQNIIINFVKYILLDYYIIMSTMRIPPHIVKALNNINLIDSRLATALTTVISHLHKMSHQDILQYSCRYQNRTMQGLGEMNCSHPNLQAISDYLMGIATGAIKGPGSVRA